MATTTEHVDVDPVTDSEPDAAASRRAPRSAKGQRLVALSRELAPRFAAHADQIEREQRFPEHLLASVGEAGFFRMMLPAELGEDDVDPVSTMELVETFARVDAAVAWCVSLANAGCSMAAGLDLAAARELFDGDPLTNVAGGPTSTDAVARRVDGGWRVTGRWTFASGSGHATLFMAAAEVHDAAGVETVTADEPGAGLPRIIVFFMPRSDVELEAGSWDTLGLRGTASGNFRATDVFVPERFAFSFYDPLRLTATTQPSSPFAAIALGVAQHALDAYAELAARKSHDGMFRAQGAPKLRELPLVQDQIGRVAAELMATRTWVYDLVEQQWAARVHGHPLSAEVRAAIPAISAHAVAIAERVVDVVVKQSGTSGIRHGAEIERCFRDIHTVATHLGASTNAYADLGRRVLGVPPVPRAQDPATTAYLLARFGVPSVD